MGCAGWYFYRLNSCVMFQGISVAEFNRYFQTDRDCRQYLFDLKWKNGYQCFYCGLKKGYKGKTSFNIRCAACGYEESPTANTLFHKMKIPLLKAFGMVYRIGVKKKGISTLELAREFRVDQKSSWLFKRKTQEALRDESQLSATEGMDISEWPAADLPIIKEKGVGLVDEKLIIALGRSRHGKLGPGFGMIDFSGDSSKPILKLNPQPKEIVTAKNKLLNDPSKLKLQNKPETRQGSGTGKKGHALVMSNLKRWLKGIHHHCSIYYVNGYLDEFFFRLNHRSYLKGIWHSLIQRFMAGSPYFHQAIAT